MPTCPGEVATQPSQEVLCAKDLSAQVSCKVAGCPPFQASCTCKEMGPVAGGGERWGVETVPPLAARVCKSLEPRSGWEARGV